MDKCVHKGMISSLCGCVCMCAVNCERSPLNNYVEGRISSIVLASECFSLQHNEALRYLKFCVDQLGNEDEAIHNYLLSLYAKAEDEMALLGFINSSTQVGLACVVCNQLCLMSN